jgi:hypothetical protein
VQPSHRGGSIARQGAENLAFARRKRSSGLFKSGLSHDELRQVGACSVFGLRDEVCGVRLHQSIHRGLLAAVARVVVLGAIRR